MARDVLRIGPDKQTSRGRSRQRYANSVLSQSGLTDSLRDSLEDDLGAVADRVPSPSRSDSVGLRTAEEQSAIGRVRSPSDLRWLGQGKSDKGLRAAEERLNRARSSAADAVLGGAPDDPHIQDKLWDLRDRIEQYDAGEYELRTRMDTDWDAFESRASQAMEELQDKHASERCVAETEAAHAKTGEDASSAAFYRSLLDERAYQQVTETLSSQLQAEADALAHRHKQAARSMAMRGEAAIQRIASEADRLLRASKSSKVSTKHGGSIADRIARLKTSSAGAPSVASDELEGVHMRGRVSKNRDRFDAT